MTSNVRRCSGILAMSACVTCAAMADEIESVDFLIPLDLLSWQDPVQGQTLVRSRPALLAIDPDAELALDTPFVPPVHEPATRQVFAGVEARRRMRRAISSNC